MEYRVIAAGGTFDHLHEGHKAFLTWLFTKAEKVLLGLTTDTYAQDTKHTVVEYFEKRKQYIEDFLKEKKLLDRLTIVPIDDVYGPLLSNEFEVDAIGVTEDTQKGAEIVNDKRKKMGLKSLSILTMKLQLGTNGQAISSSDIRAGTINTIGEMWVKEEWKQKMYTLPTNLRDQLHEPFGPILSSIPQDIDAKKIITVGDVTTKLFNMHKIGQKISIFDFVVERSRIFSHIEELAFDQTYNKILLTNSAGHIAPKAWIFIEQAIKSDVSTVIQVDGEEDLLVLVCILVAPLGYHIFYGQPHVGLVHVHVTLEAKNKAFGIMNEFISV